MQLSDLYPSRRQPKPKPEAKAPPPPQEPPTPEPPPPAKLEPKPESKKEAEKPKAAAPVPPPPQAAPKPPAPPPPAPAKAPAPVHEAVEEAGLVPARRPSPEIYGNLVAVARQGMSTISETKARPDMDSLCEAVDWVIDGLETNFEALLSLARRSTLDHYLPGHVANVCIFSLAIGKKLAWPRHVQSSVGLGVMLHDTGLALHDADLARERKLTEEEKKKFSDYELRSKALLTEFLESLTEETRRIVSNILLEFKKEEKTGNSAPAEAQIVGICDVYESLTHPRAYRSRVLPQDAYRALSKMTDRFKGSCIKWLSETLTLFPPGSFVKLSTGEIGRVVRINPSSQGQPVVEIWAGKDGAAKAPVRLDLIEEPSIHIEQPIEECLYPWADHQLAIRSKAKAWWFE